MKFRGKNRLVHTAAPNAAQKSALRGFAVFSSLALALLTAPLQAPPAAGLWHALDGRPAESSDAGGSLRPSPGFSALAIVESPAAQLELSRPGGEGPGFLPWETPGWPGTRFLASLAALDRWRLGVARSVPTGYPADRPGLSTCCPQGPPSAIVSRL